MTHTTNYYFLSNISDEIFGYFLAYCRLRLNRVRATLARVFDADIIKNTPLFPEIDSLDPCVEITPAPVRTLSQKLHDLMSLKVPALRKLATTHTIAGRSKMRKAELAQALVSHV